MLFVHQKMFDQCTFYIYIYIKLHWWQAVIGIIKSVKTNEKCFYTCTVITLEDRNKTINYFKCITVSLYVVIDSMPQMMSIAIKNNPKYCFKAI